MGLPTLILDFDGVIHSYTSGWQGIDVTPDPPVEGVKSAINELKKHFRVVVYSSRCHQEGGIEAIRKYLLKHDIWVDAIVDKKVPVVAMVDDRGITFTGEWSEEFVEQIKHFKAWYE